MIPMHLTGEEEEEQLEEEWLGMKTMIKNCFTDLSPEELRLEYYSTRASGDLQGYVRHFPVVYVSLETNGWGGFGSTFGAVSASPAAGSGMVGEATGGLFSPESKLTQEELNQFKAKRFTLGQIPLKPPPESMLVLSRRGRYNKSWSVSQFFCLLYLLFLMSNFASM
ncbi:hypothetical protein GOODEAATRI_014278 [Goodea atripinnis]|uniref:Uncharacterized protein n=1 Tax=Goodea atripinnis TaxID=208336 RepID=A0ABV0PE25_9TELE